MIIRKTFIIISVFISLASSAQIKELDNLPSKNDTTLFTKLLQYANALKVIDAHEHMISAENHAKRYLSFWDFFSSYVKWDLYSAGMPKKYLTYNPVNDSETVALFNVIEPYLPYVKYGSYMLSVKVALRNFFGVDDITRNNYLDITHKLNAENTVENYNQVFKDAHIVKLLNQCYNGKTTDSMYANITTLSWQFDMQNKLTVACRKNKAMTLQDVFAFYEAGLKQEKQNGSVGVKFFPHVFIQPYDTAVAAKQLEEIKKGKAFNQRSTLARVIYEKQIEMATKYKMVICIHTGVWADITDKTPMILFPVVAKYPDATFDVYHMGIPEIREAAFLGKNYPNVYLNLCWAYSVSENMVLNSLDEWIDLVPTNKIIGFGGDLITLPQHAVGMLEVAKHVLCKALAKRIEENRLDVPGAKKILEDWLYNNPAKVYGSN